MRRNVQRVTTIAGGIDPWLMLAVLGLTCIGVLMVYSASVASAYDYYGSAYYVIQREIVWVVIGFVALAIVIRIDYRHWQRLALPLFITTLVMLVLVLIPHVGHSSHGARRWFAIGSSISIQPSELIKLAAIMYMAAWFTAKGERIRDFQACFVPFGLMAGLITLLIVKEPDLGTAIVVAAALFTVFFIAGANAIHLGTVLTGAIAVAWGLAHSSSYRFDRLSAFVDPWKDPSGVGYHTVQALLALGSGGFFGVGLGNSTQKHVLPAPHTDSILAIIGEEWGLVGTVTVLFLFMVIAYRGMRISVSAPDNFGRLLAAGITSSVIFQALLNFAVITSSVPFTGVPLPFISYGGTSFVITMVGLGVLLSISRYTRGEGFASSSSYHGRGNGRPRVSGAGDHALPAPAPDRQKPPLRVAAPRVSGRARARNSG